MKNQIYTMLVLLAVMFTSLPLSASAHTVEAIPSTASSDNGLVGPVTTGAGNYNYYHDDRVILRGKAVPVTTVDIHIGGDPEIVGGDQSKAASDEEDVALTHQILVVTRAHSGKFLIGVVNPVIHGVQIYVRRIRATHSIIEILNCGNWTRQLGADYTFSCPEARCVAGEKQSSTTDDVSPDGLTRTVVTITTDGCETRIERTITNTVERRIEVCTTGAWVDVFEAGNSQGKLSKAFRVDDVLEELPVALQQQIIEQIPKDKVSYLFVQRGACESERNTIRVKWFTKGGWSWLSFGVGVAVGFGLSFLIPHTKIVNGIKTQTYAPVRSGISGSGNAAGGIMTRLVKP